MNKSFLAIDLGAGSGRAILGTLAEGSVQLLEVHRFANEPVTLGNTLYWNLPELFREVVRSIRLAAAATDGQLDGISVDSWGVDFCLFDRSGQPLGLPVHYRDARTDGRMEGVFETIPDDELFGETGVRSLELNTLYQLVALKAQSPELVDAADKLLLIADTMHYFLCGRLIQEETLASTTQLWNPQTHSWSQKVLEAVGLPHRLLPDVVPPATILAPLSPAICAQTGLSAPPAVIASASHDTALAIAAVPAPSTAESWAYLSSGTWSLLGVELTTPNLASIARENQFTNEVGVGGTITFLTMINGLFLLEECRRRWKAEGRGLEHADLLYEARRARASVIWPGDATLFAPADAPAAIQEFCRASGQPVPESPGAITRTILESLALTYRRGIEALEPVTGRTITQLHIVGGGSQNKLLNQLTADALGKPTFAGPAEATALGSVLVQALATGNLRSLDEVREYARASCSVHRSSPRDAADWERKFAQFLCLEETAARKG